MGVAEPDAVRREQFKRTYQLKDEDCYESYEQILAKDKLADLAMICTGDDIHIQPLELAVEKRVSCPAGKANGAEYSGQCENL